MSSADNSGSSPALVTVRLDHDEPLQVASLGQLLESLAVLHLSATRAGDAALYFDETAQRWRPRPTRDGADDVSPDVVGIGDNFFIELATLALVATILSAAADVASAVLAGLERRDRRRDAEARAAELARAQGNDQRTTQIIQQVAGDLVVNGNVYNISINISSA